MKTMFVCTACGMESPKWMGKCPGCGSWNTMEEERVKVEAPAKGTKGTKTYVGGNVSEKISQISLRQELRYQTGMAEFDRVLGGGIVKGSVVLIGGDPGIGKSTLLLQICQTISPELRVLYISGEESQNQIKLRAQRLGVENDNLYILTETDIDRVTEAIVNEKPQIVVIDSIQTMFSGSVTSIPGSITQIKECTMQLTNIAKGHEIAILLVGHVNKEGAIAGPKVLEHIVDAVIYFEGDRDMPYRILRAAKNRFGSTNELGVFDMGTSGLIEVPNPSLMLLSGKPKGVSGTCAVTVTEGTRCIIAEIQALVASANYSSPRRISSGVDYNRCAMLMAVLEKRAGLKLSSYDAFLNVVGGLRLNDPTADLAIALALTSSYKDIPIDDGLVAFGEIGLAGELRGARNAEQRIQEAIRLGFTKVMLPRQSVPKKKISEIELLPVGSINDAIYKTLQRG